jgi:hypothetical protein
LGGDCIGDRLKEDVQCLGDNKNFIDKTELDAIVEIDDDSMYEDSDYSQLVLNVGNEDDFGMKLDAVIMEVIKQFGIISTTTIIGNVLNQRDIKLY